MKLKFIPSILVLLPSSLVLGGHFTQTGLRPTITSGPSATSTPSEPTPTISTIPTNFLTPSKTHIWDPIISEATHLLNELNEHLHPDLRKRQIAGGATNAIVATTVPVQMPSVTVYQIHGVGAVHTFTQTFPPQPDPWPSPSAGTIGLGSIQGVIGVTKTISKRQDLPEPTGLDGRTIRIKGRAVQ